MNRSYLQYPLVRHVPNEWTEPTNYGSFQGASRTIVYQFRRQQPHLAAQGRIKTRLYNNGASIALCRTLLSLVSKNTKFIILNVTGLLLLQIPEGALKSVPSQKSVARSHVPGIPILSCLCTRPLSGNDARAALFGPKDPPVGVAVTRGTARRLNRTYLMVTIVFLRKVWMMKLEKSDLEIGYRN